MYRLNLFRMISIALFSGVSVCASKRTLGIMLQQQICQFASNFKVISNLHIRQTLRVYRQFRIKKLQAKSSYPIYVLSAEMHVH